MLLRYVSDIHRERWKRACTLCSAVAYCCGAVAPRAIAALLGRFLPRLGPLVHSGGPFFLGHGRLSWNCLSWNCLSWNCHGAVWRVHAAAMMEIIPPQTRTAQVHPMEASQAHRPER